MPCAYTFFPAITPGGRVTSVVTWKALNALLVWQTYCQVCENLAITQSQKDRFFAPQGRISYIQKNEN